MGTEALDDQMLEGTEGGPVDDGTMMMAQWTKVQQMPPVQVTRRYSR